MDQATLALLIWTLATLLGTVFSYLGMRELRINRTAALDARRRKLAYARVLLDVVDGNMVQQAGRAVMEVICWIAVLIAVAGTPEQQRSITIWLLVGYRAMHTFNSGTEWLSNRRRREGRFLRR